VPPEKGRGVSGVGHRSYSRLPTPESVLFFGFRKAVFLAPAILSIRYREKRLIYLFFLDSFTPIHDPFGYMTVRDQP